MELIDFILKNSTVVVLIISLYVAYRAYKTTRHLTESKNAIEFETEYHKSQKMIEAHQFIRKAINSLTSEEISKFAEDQYLESNERAHIKEFLNTWERASIAIQNDVYNEKLLYTAYNSFVIQIYIHFIPFIKVKQKKNKNVYENFVWLAVRWKSKKDSGR